MHMYSIELGDDRGYDSLYSRVGSPLPGPLSLVEE